MEVAQVFHMNGGNGSTSYASNSQYQRNIILGTKPMIEQAVTRFYNRLRPKTISIADLGCSSGTNAFLAVFNIIKAVDKAAKEIGNHSPDYVIHLNDLPANDFNNIFLSLPRQVEEFKKEMGDGFGHCFFSGVPGSFYGRLFPSNSLHFVHSSISLHWLSQIPKGLEENKGNLLIAASSPPSVIKAYYEQFEEDFLTFLKCRSKELVTGGQMVLCFAGQKNEGHKFGHDISNIWEILAKTLKDLVAEGSVDEKKLNSFNVPLYAPSLEEVKLLIEREESFLIDVLEGCAFEYDEELIKDGGKALADSMRAVVEPILASHFGQEIAEVVFERYREMIAVSMPTLEKMLFFNLVSLTRV